MDHHPTPKNNEKALPDWIRENLFEQFEFGRASVLPTGGFGWMTDRGTLDSSQPQFTWLTSRLVHVYALGVVIGIPGAYEIAATGFAGLTGPLHDRRNGGWFPHLSSSVHPQHSTKDSYVQAHVAIAAASAVAVGIPEARTVLEEALDVLDKHFWDEATGMYSERLSADWSSPVQERSATANMHCVEALLSASAIVEDTAWQRDLLTRATRITERLARHAETNRWRMPQRYTTDWTADFEANHDRPADPFAPYGATIGLGFEWARLILELRERLGQRASGWMMESAQELHHRATADGWTSDGKPGLVYTTDWDGRPIIRARLHWAHAEAVSSAAALKRATGNSTYDDQLKLWWNFIRQNITDPKDGSWRHEIDPDGIPSHHIWRGRPDLYHSVHACVFALSKAGASPIEASRSINDAQRSGASSGN